MAVRTLTLTKSKLTETGLALLDWGNWSGKPEEFEDQIMVPVWCDTHCSLTVFQVAVHPPGKIYDNEYWSIGRSDLGLLENMDVNEWWNRMSEAIMERIDEEGLLIALPEAINRLPTQNISRAIRAVRKVSRPNPGE